VITVYFINNYGLNQWPKSIVELSLNEENNAYLPHYLGFMLDISKANLSVLGWTDLKEEGKVAMSYNVNFETMILMD